MRIISLPDRRHGHDSQDHSQDQLPRATRKALPLITRLAAGLVVLFLAGCPGVLPEAVSKYDANIGSTGGVMGTGGMGGAGTGGAGTGGMPAGPCDAPTLYFKKAGGNGCATAGACHAGVFPPDLTVADPWSHLMGLTATQQAACTGMPMINATNPADSVLIKRVNGAACGNLMPFGFAVPDQAVVECITSWVNSKLQ